MTNINLINEFLKLGKMNREGKLKFITQVVGFGFYISIIYHLFMRFYFKLPYPFNTFLFRTDDNFMDFIWPYRIALDPYSVLRADFQNLPFLYAIMRIFRILGNENTALVIYLASFFLIFLLVLSKNILQGNTKHSYLSILVLCVFSYPLLFSLQRANLELLVFAFIFLFLSLYHENKKLSILFLSLAIAIKPFPIVFLALLFLDRRFKDLAITIGTSVILTFLSLLILPGNLTTNISNLLVNLALYNKVYAIGNEGLYFGHSLWGAMKYLITGINPFLKIDYSLLVKPYFYFAALLFIALLWYLYRNQLSFEKKVILLICAMDLLPFVSGDYKLMYFFIPLVMFINNGATRRFDWLYALLIGLLFVPKNYFNLPVLPIANISLLVNPMIMISLFILIIVFSKNRDSAMTQVTIP